MTDKHRFSSVWDAIEDSPEQAERMKVRSKLAMEAKVHGTDETLESRVLGADAAFIRKSDASATATVEAALGLKRQRPDDVRPDPDLG